MSDLGTMWYVVRGPKQDPAVVIKGPMSRESAKDLARHIPGSDRVVARNALYLANDIHANGYNVQWGDKADPDPVLNAEVTHNE